jgi:hypothetical protein
MPPQTPTRAPGARRNPDAGGHQPAQTAQPLQIQHRDRGLDQFLTEDIGGIGTNRARAAIGQLHHKEHNPVDTPETLSNQQRTEQRVGRSAHTHLARQHRTKMLQSVGVAPGTGKTHLAIGLGIRARQAGHRVLFATASEWVARLADAHHAGRLQSELVRLGRYPLIVVDLCRHRDYAERSRCRLADLYQAGLLALPELQQRAADVEHRRRDLTDRRDNLAAQRRALTRDNQLRQRVTGFAQRVLTVIDHLDFEQRQALLRLVVDEVRVTGWKVEIQLPIPLDDNGGNLPPGPPAPPTPDQPPPSTEDRLRSLGDHRRRVGPNAPSSSTRRWPQEELINREGVGTSTWPPAGTATRPLTPRPPSTMPSTVRR